MRCVGSQDAEEDISLPEELLTDILWKMPGQRVFEFRRLSKYYKELIDSDDFIRNHYDESIRSRPSIILHQSIRRGRNVMESVVIHLDFGSSANCCKVNTFEPPFKDEDNELRFLGCRRGILCYHVKVGEVYRVLYNDFDHLMFWNPLTGALRRSRCAGSEGISCSRFFSGHDVVTDDLKVLKITPSRESYECVIYSSATDSWTRTQGFDNLRNHEGKKLFLWTSREVFVEGSNCVHMILSEHVEYRYQPTRKILAFDFSSEKFNLVPLPKTTTMASFYLSSVDACLCLIFWPKPHYLQVWMMKKYGVEESWARILSIHRDSIPSLPTGLAVTNGRPQLLIFSSNGKPKSRLYDVHQKHVNDTHIDFDKMGIPQHFLFAPSHREP